jgi:hypothetical protein
MKAVDSWQCGILEIVWHDAGAIVMSGVIGTATRHV